MHFNLVWAKYIGGGEHGAIAHLKIGIYAIGPLLVKLI